MDKKKITKSIIKPQIQPSFASEVYIDSRLQLTVPVTKEYLYKLMKELVEHGDRPDAYDISEFYVNRGIPSSTYYSWVSRHSFFGETHKCVLAKIGTNLKRKMLENKINTKGAMHVLHKYHDEWRDADKYHSDLRKQENKDNIAADIIKAVAEHKLRDYDKDV